MIPWLKNQFINCFRYEIWLLYIEYLKHVKTDLYICISKHKNKIIYGYS
jgi:hypothetical protein